MAIFSPRLPSASKSPFNMWFVYILKCADGKLYTGCTENIEERIKRHTSAYVTATKLRLPVSLVAYIAFNDRYKDMLEELKQMSF